MTKSAQAKGIKKKSIKTKTGFYVYITGTS